MFWRSWWVLFIVSWVPGCGGDGGDNVGNASGGGSASGGTSSGGSGGVTSGGSGGSGGVAGGNLGGSAGAGTGGIAGSASGGTAGIGGALNDACHAMCEQQETGEGCIPEYTETCKQGCNAVTPSLETKCPDVALSYYDCNSNIEYVCFLALPTAKDPNACKAEGEAMNACTGA